MEQMSGNTHLQEETESEREEEDQTMKYLDLLIKK